MPNICQRLAQLTSKHEPTGGERQPVYSNTKNESGNELQTEGYSPRGIRLTGVSGTADVVGAVCDPVGDKNTD